MDVETVTDRIKKDEVRLASGNATPKELEQTQHEIQTLKKRQLALEEIELEIMVRSEAVTERSKVLTTCLLYTSPSPRDRQKSRMPSSA